MTDNCEKDQCTAFHQEYKDICNDYVASTFLDTYKKMELSKGDLDILNYCKEAINCNDCPHKIHKTMCLSHKIVVEFKIMFIAFITETQINPKEYE